MDNLVLDEEILNTHQAIQKRRRVQSGSDAFATSGLTKAIVFDTAFSSTPTIIVTPNTDAVGYAVTTKSASGFTVTRPGSGTSGAGFSWIAIGPA